jgi:hypothetical protein
MTRPEPAAALSKARSGHICDRCNRGVRTGDLVRAYATHYEREGWTLRRLWCDDCGENTIEHATESADEAILEAVFWNNRLVSVSERDRSRPYVDGGESR